MIITKGNSDGAVLAMVAKLNGTNGHRFYDQKAGVFFNGCPCENCGTMTAFPDYVTIEDPSDRVHRSLSGVFPNVEFVESVGYNDDGEERCEVCNGE